MWRTCSPSAGSISYETVRYWWNRFGPMFAAEIRRKRDEHMRAFTHWRWHLDEVLVKINGETHYLWREVSDQIRLARKFPAVSRSGAMVSAPGGRVSPCVFTDER